MLIELAPNHSAPREPVFLSLHRSLALLLRKNRFLRKLTHTKLTRAEVHTLIEIQAAGFQTITSLQSLLGMDQSSISRIVMGLTKRRAIRSIRDQSDKRLKILTLSPSGDAIVKRIDAVAGKFTTDFVSKLQAGEEDMLCELFKRIADHHGHPPCNYRNDERQIRMQQRRMSRALGVLTQNLLGSGLSSSQWHVFSEICTPSYPPSPKELSHMLGIPPNSLSVILEKLESLGFILKKSAKHDSRIFELYPTAKGLAHHRAVELSGTRDLESVLCEYSAKQIEQVANAMRRYVDEKSINFLNELEAGYTIAEIPSGTERDRARAFAIIQLVKQDFTERAPSRLLLNDSCAYGLYSDKEELSAVCEVQTDTHMEVTLLVWKSAVPLGLVHFFLKRSIELAQLREGGSDITYAFEPAARLISRKGNKAN